jgi:hypothetical protein
MALQWDQDKATYNWYAKDVDGTDIVVARVMCPGGTDLWVLAWTSVLRGLSVGVRTHMTASEAMAYAECVAAGGTNG